MEHPFLAVAGNIGSGKTTLTKKLVERLGVRGLFESTAANPYLADFYHDMPRYALPLQLRFLAMRVGETRETQKAQVSAVQDRTCYEDAHIFAANLHARGALDERDWETYQILAAQLFEGLTPPDLVVYLHRTPEGCRAQIQKRGREYEQSMPAGYLEDLGMRYDGWFDSYALGPKLLIEGNDFDFLNRPEDLEAVVELIANTLPQPSLPFV